MAYNRILLPVDGSEHSMHAVAHAVSLVREGGEIVVATVLPPIPNVIGGDAVSYTHLTLPTTPYV